MNIQRNTLAAAVDDFVASLSVERKAGLSKVVLNSQFTTSWPWYQEVIDRYLKGPDASALLREIEMHHPGAEFYNLAKNTKGVPIYEASVILKAAQKILGK